MLYSLPSRDIIADSVEYMVNAHKADAMVCISNCDKITPGMLMASMRLNIPTIFVSGGPMEAGELDNRHLDLIDAMIEPFTKEDAEAAAKLYDHSRRLDRMLSFQDALIAGQAISRNFVLVSGGRRAGFELYADMGLKYENWLDPLSQTPPSTLLNDLL